LRDILSARFSRKHYLKQGVDEGKLADWEQEIKELRAVISNNMP